MISVTSAQLGTWLALFLFPFARVAALIGTAPVLGDQSVPVQVKIGIAVLVTLVIAPALPVPALSVGSGAGLLAIAMQIAAGIAMGLAVRIALVAVNLAGELVGLQMGLSFATFFDPQNSAQTPVLSELLSVLTTLVFLALNGHLIMFSVLAQSFTAFPVDAAPSIPGAARLFGWGAQIFAAGLLLSLPAVVALLITNLALGVLTRAAPQLNIFAVGFPVTLAIGFFVMAASLPHLARPIGNLIEQGLSISQGLFSP